MWERTGFAKGELHEELGQQWNTLPADNLGTGTGTQVHHPAAPPSQTTARAHMQRPPSINHTGPSALWTGAPAPEAGYF
jgi:hypothetical protein